jgi:hypothetical protein
VESDIALVALGDAWICMIIVGETPDDRVAGSMLVERARGSRRWGVVHAFPTVTNGASNGICRSLGFTLAGHRHAQFAGRTLFTNHWRLDLP